MPEFHFTIPGTERLASLAGIKADLGLVLEYCDRMIQRYAGEHLKKDPFDIVGFTTPVDFLDWEALSTAACIAYARCFVTGIRNRLDESLLDVADPEFRDLHEFVLNLRNKHIAHSVNLFEENSVTIHVEDEFLSSKEICSVVPRHTRQAGVSLDTPMKLKALADWWLTRVEAESSREIQSVLGLAREMPLEQLRALSLLKSTSSEDRNSNIAKRRQRP